MTYGKVHRIFLRSLMIKGVFTEREAKRVLQNSSDQHHELTTIISEINSMIRPLSQDIKRVRHESTGEYHIVIVWTGLGEAAMSQGLYSQHDVLFWRKLLEEIAVADGKRISAIDALNLCSGISGITKTRAQDLMDEWVVAQYLEKFDDGNYILGIRGIHEFEPYLRLNLPDSLDACTLCTKSVFQGKQCDHCGKYFHKFCLNTAKGKMKTWPCCKQVYNEDISMQEDCSAMETVTVNLPNESGDRGDTSNDDGGMNLSQEF